jgi:hypothetical protein
MKKEKHVVISKGNIKMGQIQSVSLPPVVTCSPLACKFCGKKCYARKICKLRRTVKESYDNNLDILLHDKEKFWREVEGSIKLTTYFRFFVSGDIYDKDFLENMVLCARKNKHCNILCFTKKYSLVNEYLEHHRLPKNLNIVFSAWKGLEMPNPFNLPTAEVMYKDGTSTAEEGKKYIYCSGNCSECISEKRSCWNLKKGEGVIFAEH